MEVRLIRVERNDDAPFSGAGLVVVLAKHDNSVELFYPFTLDEFWMARYSVYLDGKLKEEGYEDATREDEQYWPTNTSGRRFEAEKLVATLYRKVREEAELGRSIENVRTVIRVLTELSGSALVDVEKHVGELIKNTLPGRETRAGVKKSVAKHAKRFRIKPKLPKFAGRRGAVIEVMRELGDCSMLQIIEASRSRIKTSDRIERVVTFFVNELVRKGMAEEIG